MSETVKEGVVEEAVEQAVADGAGEVVADGTAEPVEPVETAETAETRGRGFRKTRVGVVVSDKMDKTVVVAIVNRARHPLYKKIVKRTYKLKAHDQNNECRVGDKVRVMETRPLSKEKRWRLVEIVEKAR